MKVDAIVATDNVAHVADQAAEYESAGWSGAWTIETAHDPFLPLAVASTTTNTIDLGTSIAVGFARNPMTLANIGWDLQCLTDGRFVLGLGSQIKPHITKRFSMPWSQPAARMREMVLAVRTIWDCWRTGSPLRFRGEYYTHTLMTPFFSPDPAPIERVGLPRIMLAGVGPLMTQVAGEVADGFFCHGFTTERYLRERTIPALIAGRAEAGKTLDGFEISGPSFIVTGTTDEAFAAADAAVRQQIAFYGSTPAYLPVMELHGWEDLHTDLHTLSKRGAWDQMAALISDNVLETFAVVATPDSLAAEIGRRYGDIVTRIALNVSSVDDGDVWREVVQRIQAL